MSLSAPLTEPIGHSISIEPPTTIAFHITIADQPNSGVSTVLKGLCITALTIAVIVFALFLADLVFGMAGMPNMAPFKYTNLVMDIIFILCSAVLAVMSWLTFREQV